MYTYRRMPGLFLALDYLHTECKVIRAGKYFTPEVCFGIILISALDTKADNTMFGIADDSGPSLNLLYP